jgi:hypothetical protein
MQAIFTVMTAIMLALVLAPGAVMAQGQQGFQVRPLSVDGEVPPGADVRIPIEITPTSQVDRRTLNVEVAQLAQKDDGGLTAVAFEPGTEQEHSAAPWITVPEEVTIAPREATTLEVQMDVPTSARGAHAAALILSAPPPEDAQGLRLTMRVLIPVIVGTEGRPARQNVRLSGATLRYRFPGESEGGARPETTIADIRVENRGGTFSRYRGNIWVDVAKESGGWRQVRRVPIPEGRILPQAAVTLPVDLGRLLPAGDYRLRGALYVDGRRTAPLRQEIAFEGHPDVGELVTDVALGIEPELFEYAFRAGAVRSGRISVTNPALDPVEVSIDVALPAAMAGRATAELRGEEMSAAGWIDVSPGSFRLRPGQTRNLRLLARLPDTPPPARNSYAAIKVAARYLDGQRAGKAEGLVEVTRPDGADRPALELAPVRLAATGEDGVYALSQRATNTGNVVVRPDISWSVLDAGGTAVASGTLESEIASPLMPLADRDYGGTLDAAGLPDGPLRLLTVARGGEGEIGERVQPIDTLATPAEAAAAD